MGVQTHMAEDLQYRYVIVGGGMTADAAVAGIRAVDPDGPIAMLSEEPFMPYNRPPLSKGLFKGERVEQIWRQIDYPGMGVDLYLTTRAASLDPADHAVTDASGRRFRYDRLLLATGGTPVTLPHLPESVVYYRTLRDYFHVARHGLNARRVAVLGGGFIGSEMAAAFALQHKDVHQIFPEAGVLGRVLPSDLSADVTRYYGAQGVTVHAGTVVEEARAEGGRTRLRLSTGEELEVDLMVAGLGIRPRVELAASAGIAVENGIRVDAALRTSAPDVYAAGDVASIFNSALGQAIRVEHEDNANAMGEAAGRSMAGASVEHDYLPFFYSDLFDRGFEAVGLLDASLATVADWKEPYQEGVVYYLNSEGRVVGALLWNAWERVDAARAVIAAQTRYTPVESVRGAIPLG
jgi:3-phenylpropionate/trans-cinnamate dioxygenase ferredoxin reductase subunit